MFGYIFGTRSQLYTFLNELTVLTYTYELIIFTTLHNYCSLNISYILFTVIQIIEHSIKIIPLSYKPLVYDSRVVSVKQLKCIMVESIIKN